MGKKSYLECGQMLARTSTRNAYPSPHVHPILDNRQHDVLWKIAWRSIQQRSLASLLTAISMALGVMLVVAVLVVYSVVHQAFHRGGEGYDLIVGPPKGSNLDLVLSSVFYVGQPITTLPYSVYQDLYESRIGLGRCRSAVPVCLGDTYQDKRVVGTTPDMFNELTYYGDQQYEFAEGQNFGTKRLLQRRGRGRRGQAARAEIGRPVPAHARRRRQERRQARGLHGRRHLEAHRHAQRQRPVRQYRRLLPRRRACRQGGAALQEEKPEASPTTRREKKPETEAQAKADEAIRRRSRRARSDSRQPEAGQRRAGLHLPG